jgi:hypothetical protein
MLYSTNTSRSRLSLQSPATCLLTKTVTNLILVVARKKSSSAPHCLRLLQVALSAWDPKIIKARHIQADTDTITTGHLAVMVAREVRLPEAMMNVTAIDAAHHLPTVEEIGIQIGDPSAIVPYQHARFHLHPLGMSCLPDL